MSAQTPTSAQTPASAQTASERAEDKLLKIQEAAAEVSLTPRSVRYYEEIGLLRPAARSEGDYRLYDQTDVERLRFIKGLRDDAGFSLAEIAQLLEDEAARERGHEAYHATTDPATRSRILRDRADRYREQIDMLETKIERLQAMVDQARTRLDKTTAKIEALSGGAAPAPASAGAERPTEVTR
jgi:DNA-binding transcriptional MerR regulator